MSCNNNNRSLRTLYNKSYLNLSTRKLKYSTINYRCLVKVNKIIEKIINKMQERMQEKIKKKELQESKQVVFLSSI